MSAELKAKAVEVYKNVKDLNPNHTPAQTKAVKGVIELFLSIFVFPEFENAKKLLSPHYKQHNPYLGDGIESPLQFATWRRSQAKEVVGYDGPPDLIFHRITIDGDLLFVHLEWVNYPGDKPINIMDLLRWNGHQFTEHWDANQIVPDESELKNHNGVFA